MHQRYPRGRAQVRLHDVSPLTWDACHEWIELGRLLSLPPMDLFVIPRHEGGPLDRGAGLPREFVARLKELHSQGHRLWAHGWTHRKEGGGEDEFSGLDAVHAADRARRALNDWKAAGLPDPAGFCPPCWRMTKHALPAICRLGFPEVDLRMGVWSPEGLRLSPALSSWGGGRSVAASLWDRTLVRQDTLLRASGLPRRIALHPQDLDGPSRGPMETILDRIARDQAG
jgi:predicted deacetylase